jgi:MFS family permease
VHRPNPPSGWLLLALLLSSCMVVVSSAGLSAALPALRDRFADTPHVDLLVRMAPTMPAAMIALTAFIVGTFVDRIGRRPVLIASLVLFGAAGSVGSLLPSLYLILASRAVLGLAVVGLMTACTALIADYLDGDHRARFMGVQGGTMACSGVLVLIGGGVLSDISWRAPFLVYLVGWLLLPFVIGVVREPSDQDALLQAGGPSGGASTKAGAPLITVAMLCGLVFVTQITFNVLPVQFALHWESVSGASGSESGIYLGGSSLLCGIAAFSYGPVKRRLTYPLVTAGCWGVMGAGFVMIGLARSAATMVPAVLVAGAGAGMVMPNLMAWLAEITPPRQRGRALGALMTSVYMGQFTSPLAAQPILEVASSGTLYRWTGAGLVVIALAWIFACIASSRRSIR